MLTISCLQLRVQGIPTPTEDNVDFLDFPVFTNNHDSKRFRRQDYGGEDYNSYNGDYVPKDRCSVPGADCCLLPEIMDPNGKFFNSKPHF